MHTHTTRAHTHMHTHARTTHTSHTHPIHTHTAHTHGPPRRGRPADSCKCPDDGLTVCRLRKARVWFREEQRGRNNTKRDRCPIASVLVGVQCLSRSVLNTNVCCMDSLKGRTQTSCRIPLSGVASLLGCFLPPPARSEVEKALGSHWSPFSPAVKNFGPRGAYLPFLVLCSNQVPPGSKSLRRKSSV